MPSKNTIFFKLHTKVHFFMIFQNMREKKEDPKTFVGVDGRESAKKIHKLCEG